ncbi:MAG TPA: hypothetical protein VHM91_18980, partial [Verrucomicrobiales bacterium]|nr:hypothetical protein [Verrucomicrobiales bacterium]
MSLIPQPAREPGEGLDPQGPSGPFAPPAAELRTQDPPGTRVVQGRFSLCVLFFLHAAAMAAYAVPFP